MDLRGLSGDRVVKEPPSVFAHKTRSAIPAFWKALTEVVFAAFFFLFCFSTRD